jgi:hypothetical protein
MALKKGLSLEAIIYWLREHDVRENMEARFVGNM